MLPFFARDQLIYGGDSDAVSFAYLAQNWSVRLFPEKQYLAGLRLSQFTVRSVSAALPIISALGYAIANIVSVFPKPEMARVAAWRIIALMEDVYSFWNWAVGKSPRQSMGSLKPFAIPRKSITGLIFRPSPRPARVGPAGLVHLAPELLYGGRLYGCIAMMAKASIMLVAQAQRLVLFGTAIDPAKSHGEFFTSYGRKAQQ